MLDFETLSVQDLNNTGVALCAEGNFDQGIVLLRKAQAARPNDPDLCCSLGNALGEHGDIDAARHYLNRAIYLDPEHQPALTILAALPVSTFDTGGAEDENSGLQPIVEMETLPQTQTVETPDTQTYVDYVPALDTSDRTEEQADSPVESSAGTVIPAKAEVIETLIVKTTAQPSVGPTVRIPVAQVAKPRRKMSWFLPFGTFVILIDGLAYWHFIHHKPKPSPAPTPVTVSQALHYSITKTLPDTPSNRLALLNRPWKTPAASFAPASARVLPNYYEIVATNKSGVAVGARVTNHTLQAFSATGKNAVDLGDLPKDTESGAIAINDNGLIVGYSGKDKYTAVLWTNKKTIDLNTLVFPASTAVLRKAVSIDNQGDIVATATDPKGKLLIVSMKPHL